MLRPRHDALPFRGSSHHFVGADHADVNVSVFLFNGAPGAGPAPQSPSLRRSAAHSVGRRRWNVVKGAGDDSALTWCAVAAYDGSRFGGAVTDPPLSARLAFRCSMKVRMLLVIDRNGNPIIVDQQV